MNTPNFEFECLCAFGSVNIDIRENEIFAVDQDRGEVMSAFLSPELKGCLSDIVEDTVAHNAVRISRAVAAIEQTGARWRVIRDAQYHLSAFEEAIDLWPDDYDEYLNSPAAFVSAFWEYVCGMETDSDTYLDETPTSEAIEALRLRILKLREEV
jgi:hypothetical protein